MSEGIAGKFLLEILTTGMYSNPLHIYREYIQNATDSIDNAIIAGLLQKDEGSISININLKDQSISIKDNGTGLEAHEIKSKLLSLGNSTKDPSINRGFRGIGRISGLGYADKVCFITSSVGDKYKRIMSCDCVKMRELLQQRESSNYDVVETFKSISEFSEAPEEYEEHYFEVILKGISPAAKILLNDLEVNKYLAMTAPVDFDGQRFPQRADIINFFKEKGIYIPSYNIFRVKRKLPVYKLYSRSIDAGRQKKNRAKDYIHNIDFIYEETTEGTPLYIGWLAVTDFSGQINDKSIQGIRLRKGNILIGDNTTFSKFFPAEGEVANKAFAGEIHLLHDGLIPNSQRDDLEPNDTYLILLDKLQTWAAIINKKYRRGTSEVTSAIRKIQLLNTQQKNLEKDIESGSITSDIKREEMAECLKKIEKRREREEKIIKKAEMGGTIAAEQKERVTKIIEEAKVAEEKVAKLSSKIITADYATKKDLPSSYSRDERKLYQTIIAVIDRFFYENTQTAQKLREEIKKELRAKKK